MRHGGEGLCQKMQAIRCGYYIHEGPALLLCETFKYKGAKVGNVLTRESYQTYSELTSNLPFLFGSVQSNKY